MMKIPPIPPVPEISVETLQTSLDELTKTTKGSSPTLRNRLDAQEIRKELRRRRRAKR